MRFASIRRLILLSFCALWPSLSFADAIPQQNNVLVLSFLNDHYFYTAEVLSNKAGFPYDFNYFTLPSLSALNSKMTQTVEDTLHQLGYAHVQTYAYNIPSPQLDNGWTQPANISETQITEGYIHNLLQPYVNAVNLLKPFQNSSHAAVDTVVVIQSPYEIWNTYGLNCANNQDRTGSMMIFQVLVFQVTGETDQDSKNFSAQLVSEKTFHLEWNSPTLCATPLTQDNIAQRVQLPDPLPEIKHMMESLF